MLNRKKIHSYLVLAACFGLIAITFGLVNIQGIFFDSISEELNVGKGAISIYVVLIQFSGCFLAPIGYKLRTKYSIRQIIAGCGAIVLIGLFLLPVCTKIWQIYICGFLIGFGQGIYGSPMVVDLINKYFEKASSYVGISMCASGVYGMIFSPIIVDSIVKKGWRNAYSIFTISVLVVLIFSYIAINDKPNKEKDTDNTKSEGNAVCKETVFVSTVYVFYSFMAAMGGFLLGFATDIGLSMSQGAALSSAISIGNLVLKLFFGILCDHIGGFKTTLLSFALITLGVIILVFVPAKAYYLIMIGTIFLGSSYAGSNVLIQGICEDLFGKENVSKYYATITSLASLQALGSAYIGFTYDLTTSYNFALISMNILIGISILFTYFAFKLRKVNPFKSK